MIFEQEYFKKMDFSQKQIEDYFTSAIKYMKIAEKYISSLFRKIL